MGWFWGSTYNPMYAQCVFEEGKIENAQNSLSVVINMSVSNRTICKATPLEIVTVEGITALLEREREQGREGTRAIYCPLLVIK